MSSAPVQPERLGSYDIVDTLVQARAGWVVYKGFDPILRRTATLRTIPKKLLQEYGSSKLARLESEILAASRLHHPGIVGVYEFAEQGDFAYIASEYVEGPYLKERVRLPLPDAISLIVQMLLALDFAHSQSVVHRGIKPSNLLLNAKGQLRIAHFGVAELDSGTPSYMSPEQFSGAPLDRRTDIFSSAIVFYEVLTGASPFAGPAENLSSRVCNSAECPPSEVNPEIPRAFDRICARALAKNVQDRYPSARAFCEEVREAYEQARGLSLTRVVSNEAAAYATQVLSVAEHEFSSSRDAGRTMASAAVSAWGEQTLRKVEKQLAMFIGPVAKIRVREAAIKATDLASLYSILAEGLSIEEERRAFLAQRSGSAPAPPEQESKPPERTVARQVAPLEEGKRVPQVQSTPAPEPRKEPKSIPSPPAVVRPEPVPAPVDRAQSPGLERNIPQKSDVSSSSRAPGTPAAPRPPAPPAAPRPEASSPRPAAPPAPLKPEPPKPEPPDTAARLEELVGKQPDTLAAYLKDGPPQIEEVILPFVATVQALIALYATGAKKEALNPQNITFDRMGKATIQLLPMTGTGGTSSSASNPRYAAPEMFSEKASSGGDKTMTAAHIYALGVMFYEILLGKRLFAKSFADQRSELDWMRWHADPESKAPALKSLLPDYPVALSDLVESMMQKDPAKRPPDLETLLSRLRSIAQRANKTIVLSKKQAAKSISRPDNRIPDPAPKKQHTALWVLLVFAILAAAGGVWLWQNPDFVRTVIAPLLHFSN